MYARSARIYDLLYTGTRIKDYAAEADVLHAIIQRVHPDARTLLDVACGTGAHLAFLRERYEVAGLIVDGWVRPDAWMHGHRPPAEYADDGTLGVVRLTHSRREDRITTLEMHHLVRDQSGIEHFVEHHVMAMTPAAEYVAAAESAGLGVEVEADYMPGRDRIIAVRRA